MSSDVILAFLVILLGAAGTFLLLPHKHGAAKPRNVHLIGGSLDALALLLFAFFWSPPGPWLSSLFFYTFACGAIVAAVLTVTTPNPIHSALWFAAVVLASSGLFLLAGAQFLAVGTVIVYAGAIIVTFLFVIMLAQMEGRAPYDRAARMPFIATWTCFILFFGVLWSIFHMPAGGNDLGEAVSALPRATDLATLARPGAGPGMNAVLERAIRPTARLDAGPNQPKPHVAGLGETLYTDHLITVELAGALLFVALVGALMLAAPKPPTRPAARTDEPHPAAAEHVHV